MKQIFSITIILLLLYLICQILYGYFVGKHMNTVYNVKVDNKYYVVTETFNANYKTDNKRDYNNYYYEIKREKSDVVLFSFKLIGDYNGEKNFLKDFKLYQDTNIICMYPIFKEYKNDIDVICNKNNKQLNYLNIKGQITALDNFVSTLKKEGYNHYSWGNVNMDEEKYNNIVLYSKNLLGNHYIALWNYKGIYNINKNKQEEVRLLAKDQYDNFLEITNNQYYIIPDYNHKNTFIKLIVIDLSDSSRVYLDLKNEISYDSFIQGIVNNNLYIIDRSNKKQYEINLDSDKVNVIGDVDNGTQYYQNGRWDEKTIYNVIDNNLTFEDLTVLPESLSNYNAYDVDSVMGDTDGYYYLYIKNGDNTDVYRGDKQNPDILTLLFSASSIDSIKYIDNYLYFLNKDTLYVYNDYIGLRPLIKNNEFSFNKRNMYDVYISK